MISHVIGINGGGTHTTFVLADSDLREIARVEGGASNPNVVGREVAHDNIQQGVNSLLQTAGIGIDQVKAIGGGFAGLDRPADHDAFRALFEGLYPGLPLALDNDAVPVLVAFGGTPYGIVIISGTGMISLGMNAAGERARSGGWGHHVDRGSGYWIAREGLYSVYTAFDKGQPSALAERMMAKIGAAHPPEAISWLYAPERRITDLAGLAAEVVQLANTGDIDAVRIMVSAADALAQATLTVARTLRFTEPFPVVLSGSIFTYSDVLREHFTAAVQAEMPHARPVFSPRDAAIGAAMMALSAAGLPVPHPADSEMALHSPPPPRATERRNFLSLRGHQMPTLAFISTMNIEDSRVGALVAPVLPRLAALIDAAVPRFERGGRVFYAGAGTSGRMGVLDAAECVPTFSTDPEQIIALLAGGQQAVSSATESAEDDANSGAAMVAAHKIGADDIVIGLAASGTTPFVIGVLQAARARGALTGSVACTVNAPISQWADYALEIPTGAEILTGSTRLKAGTAQKMVLNMFSTGLMQQIGKVYSNLMIDMKASNSKLRERAIRIVAAAAGISTAEAAELMVASNREMKTAIVAARLGVSPEEARQRLAEVGGKVGRLLP